ncbi:Fructose-1,6-bisphosphatase class 3, partial [Striga asiatica]
MHARLEVFFPNLNSKYRADINNEMKKLQHVKFLATTYYKHGHALGYMFHAYLDVVCTAMENINRKCSFCLLVESSSFPISLVDQYARRTAIEKIRLYRVRKENLRGRVTLREGNFVCGKQVWHPNNNEEKYSDCGDSKTKRIL